jgi:hypothetical protein
MPNFSVLCASGLLLLTANLFPVAAIAAPAKISDVPCAPFVSFGVSDQGSITNLGAVFGDDFIRFAAAVSYYQGNYVDDFGPNRDLDFTNLDVSMRFGKFSELSVYGEVGFALDDIITDVLLDDDDNDFDYYPNQRENDAKLPDLFIGIAGGFEQKSWSLTAFGHYRYLPSFEDEYLRLTAANPNPVADADVHQMFAGVEFALRF